MNIAVRIRRAIVQNKGFLPFVAWRILIQLFVIPIFNITGSRLAKSPRIGKPVSGKFNVFVINCHVIFQFIFQYNSIFAKRLSLFLRLVQFELSTLQKKETLSHCESYGRIPLQPFAHKYSEKIK